MPLFCALVLTCHLLNARVGESRSKLEERLESSGLGKEYPSDVVDKKIQHGDLFYRWLYRLLPEGTEHVVYFKTADGARAGRDDVKHDNLKKIRYPDGWDLHVIYLNGQSVFEAYRRNGPNPNQYEIETILSLNQGNSSWVKVPGNQNEKSVFGYEYEREDEELRAKRQGRVFIIYYKGLDVSLWEKRQEELEEDKVKQQDSLEDSILGF